MHHINVPLQVCLADWGVLYWVQGRRGWWQLRGLASKAPKASRWSGGSRVVDNRGECLANSVKGTINVIMSSTPAPAGPYRAVGLRRHDRNQYEPDVMVLLEH